ncbi:MAG: prolipoprotein diacylglyceryl transferase [Gemmataceae bacterium]|nr:prolipoprotein diacylglyceryl transferase [Gemmataceae bacterium]
MQQVLFRVPGLDLPIYGYGTMLFLAFVLCTWLAARLGKRDGIPREAFQDLSIWLFVFGILGARLTYYFQYRDRFQNFAQITAIWDGGLVFYGSLPGAVFGYFLAYRFQLKKYGVSHWKIADIVAPCLCLGLALGRVGCLLNGCCFGNVSCTDGCPALYFPMASPPRFAMVERGYQSAAGFVLETVNRPKEEPAIVYAVSPGSPAEEAGLRPGDRIVQVNTRQTPAFADVYAAFTSDWPRGQNALYLEVKNQSGEARVVGPFYPQSIGLHPTQLYETISMVLLMFALLAYFELRRYEGAVMVAWMYGYGVHRFLNEMLRTDTAPVAFGMTLSQNISILILISATVLLLIARTRRPVDPNAPTEPAAPSAVELPPATV